MLTQVFFLLQGAPPAGGGGGLLGTLGMLMPMVLIFFVFYFLIILPQRKRQKELAETVSQLKAGDKIVTQGGIIATVTAVRDTTLLIRSADKSMLEVSRASVAGLYQEGEKKS
ncbi:MAG TPA: preprotein translocase subunit YajC [Pyrinomonadaceae bacterium]|nr:preprotein translocase subunit YajC [Pyrinomonadaceae bacterium]